MTLQDHLDANYKCIIDRDSRLQESEKRQDERGGNHSVGERYRERWSGVWRRSRRRRNILRGNCSGRGEDRDHEDEHQGSDDANLRH